MSTAEVLKMARDLISDRRGWIQGREIDFHGYMPPSYCSNGALKAASRSVSSAKKAQEALASAIPEKVFPNGSRIGFTESEQIVMFNDWYQTRHEDVLDVFDTAIARAEHDDG